MIGRDWTVGMKVVCICTAGNGDPPPYPEVGRIYTISHIYALDCHGRSYVMVDLAELPSPASGDWARGYVADGFRPVQPRKTDISVFKRMLTGNKQRERV